MCSSLLFGEVLGGPQASVPLLNVPGQKGWRDGCVESPMKRGRNKQKKRIYISEEIVFQNCVFNNV